jgi:hypothetical protein
MVQLVELCSELLFRGPIELDLRHVHDLTLAMCLEAIIIHIVLFFAVYQALRRILAVSLLLDLVDNTECLLKPLVKQGVIKYLVFQVFELWRADLFKNKLLLLEIMHNYVFKCWRRYILLGLLLLMLLFAIDLLLGLLAIEEAEVFFHIFLKRLLFLV